MRKAVFCLVVCSLLYSCRDDSGFVKSVDFVLDNSVENIVTGKIYTTKGFNEVKGDSIAFRLAVGETKTVTWGNPDMLGEGSFEIYIDQERKRRFGYFTNGVSLEASFDITIEADTIIVL